MHIASYEKPTAPPPRAMIAPAKPTAQKPVAQKPAGTKSIKIAAADALAPLPGARLTAKAAMSAAGSTGGAAPRKTKESGTPR